jgi:ribosome biogenesis protein Nip4
MRRITEFAKQFGIDVILNEDSIVEKQGRLFALKPQMKKLPKDFFCAGAYLGKTRRGIFFPSFILLSMLAASRNANKVMVDQKTEWLFIVGRDIFRQGVLKVFGKGKRGAYTLVVNQHGECLGFGRILQDLGDSKEKSAVVVKNVSDIGDFLRREKHEK